MVRALIRLEGVLVLLVSLYIYNYLGYSWIAFLALILVPDLSAVGYLVNKRGGAVTYNLVHNYLLVAILIVVGIIGDIEFSLQFGIILAAHIGMDRAVGYGLKYPSDFKDTHINKL